MTLSGRDDNRMFVFDVLDVAEPIECNLQATGREPLMFRVETSSIYVSYDKNRWLELDAGLYLFEEAHPFGGQFFIKKKSGLATVTFMVGGAI